MVRERFHPEWDNRRSVLPAYAWCPPISLARDLVRDHTTSVGAVLVLNTPSLSSALAKSTPPHLHAASAHQMVRH